MVERKMRGRERSKVRVNMAAGRRLGEWAGIAALGLGLLLAPTSALAVLMTASEEIRDTLGTGLDILFQDLQRIRIDSTGTTTENADATINSSSQNNVNSAFGRYGTSDVVYRHRFDWLTPAATSLLSATLTIQAFGPDGNNDVVFGDSINLGSLTGDGATLSESIRTTIFSVTNPTQLNIFLGDGYVDVLIDKNRGAGFPGNLDSLNVYNSKLSIQYDSPVAVTHPAAVLILGAGLLAAAIASWRRARG